MKSILISIKPRFVAKILNGEKNIEIRKSYPKCELPIDVYIYCTKDSKEELTLDENTSKWFVFIGKYRKCTLSNLNHRYIPKFNGKVVAKFTLNKVEEILPFIVRETKLGFAYELTEEKIINCQRAQLTYDEYNHYLKGKVGYAWHISNLEIFDRPLPLQPYFDLDRAPQSFSYINTME